jgi:hypothetical protein
MEQKYERLTPDKASKKITISHSATAATESRFSIYTQLSPPTKKSTSGHYMNTRWQWAREQMQKRLARCFKNICKCNDKFVSSSIRNAYVE